MVNRTSVLASSLTPRLIIFSFLFLAIFITTSPTADAQNPQIDITPAAGPPGTHVTIEGTGFQPGDDYGWAVLLYGSWLQGGSITSTHVKVDSQGNFTVDGQIPWEAPDGLHGVAVFFNPDNPDKYDSSNPNQVSAQTAFTVTDRNLMIFPNYGPFGSRVCMLYGGFGPDAAGCTPELLVNHQPVDPQLLEMYPLTSVGDIQPTYFKVSSDLGFQYGDNVVQIEVDLDEPPDGNPEMVAGTTLTINRPTLEINPDSGFRGTTVTATGSGWLTGLTDFVTIYYQQTGGAKKTAYIVRPNHVGNFITQFTIPTFQMDHDEIELQIWAEDASNNTSLTSIFTVGVPQLRIEPESAPAGNPVTIFGKGFRPRWHIQEVSIGNVPVTPLYQLGLTSGTGSFMVKGTVPGVIEGGQVVKARVMQHEGEAITYPFTVTGSGIIYPSNPPQISIDPQSGYAGDPVTIQGINFTPMAWLQEVSIEGAPILPVNQLGQTSGSGSFCFTGTVPAILPGSRQARVRVKQREGEEITIPFNVLGSFNPGTPPWPPHIDVAPDLGYPGEEITVTGIKFMPLTPVKEVSIGSVSIVPPWELPITGATGSFSITGTIPEVMEGGQVVKVRVTQDEGDEITVPFTVYRGYNTTFKEGLKSVSGKYETVWTFDAGTQQWEVYQPGLPDWMPQISGLKQGQGYWIKVTEDCSLTHRLNTWELREPWNLIGWME